MIGLVAFVFLAAVALGTGLYAAWSDVRGMVIPNTLPLVIAALAVPAGLIAHFLYPQTEFFARPLFHLAAGALVFAVTFVMFSAKLMGGGDSKLLSAYALWTGLAGLPAFLIYTMTAGFFLGISALAIRKFKPFKNPREGGWIARLQAGEKVVPYGVAIALGAAGSFYYIGYLEPGALAVFVTGGAS